MANSIWTGEPILRCQYSPHYQCSLLKQGREGGVGSKCRTEGQFWKMPSNWLIEAMETVAKKTHTTREHDTSVARPIVVGRHYKRERSVQKNCFKTGQHN